MADFATWDRQTLERFAADASQKTLGQEDEITRLRDRIRMLTDRPGPSWKQLALGMASKIDECAPYLKDGETPLQRIERDHRDSLALMTLLAAEKRKNKALERGEWICSACGLRKDADRPTGGPEF